MTDRATEDDGWIYSARDVMQLESTPTSVVYAPDSHTYEQYAGSAQPTFFAAAPFVPPTLSELQQINFNVPAQATSHPGPSKRMHHQSLARHNTTLPLDYVASDNRTRKRRREASPDSFNLGQVNFANLAPTRANVVTRQCEQTKNTQTAEGTHGIITLATKGLAMPRAIESSQPAVTSTDNTLEEALATAEDIAQRAVMEEIYSVDGETDSPANLTKLYSLIDRLLSKQDEMTKTIERLQYNPSGTQRASGDPAPHSYTSPPKPPQDPVWNQSIPCTLPAGRQARAARHTQILAAIREAMLKLLNIPPLKKGGTLPPPPLPAIHVLTREYFALRWDETEKSTFNRSAAGILTQVMLENGEGSLTANEKENLPKMIQQHIRYLCRQYKNENRSDAKVFNARRLKNCAKDSRKRTLFETRMRVIDRFPVALGKHRQLMVHLGVSGTSSDEEDENNPQIFKIRRRRELSTQVAQLKSNLDFVYALYYKGPGSKGSQLHHRIPSELIATRPLSIAGLPITCLNRGWLSELSEAEKEFYRFQPHKYDYAFPQELFVRPDEAYALARALSVDPEPPVL
ncbi:hypothetical protein RhiJN_15084 [Ceratobasidium sp. AG-Ba]|nr:hypothetical protein RhiJN_15084 [Ceratobasidium sp. AG-Ba]